MPKTEVNLFLIRFPEGLLTQINYSDLTRFSPSEELQLEIRSPDNDPESLRDDPGNQSRNLWGGFQRDFEYRVVQRTSGKTVWSRLADRESWLDAPNDAWVSDNGHVVVITREPFSSHLVVLDSDGGVALQCDVGSELLDDSERELHWTSAGPHWNESGIGLFFEANGRKLWSFRTKLGRQILINLDSAVVHEASDAKDQLKQVQVEFALSTLQFACRDERLFEPNAGFLDDDRKEDDDRAFDKWFQYMSSIWAAVTWSGADGLDAALPLLRKMEESTVFNSYTSGWSTPESDKTTLVQLRFVSAAQMALRCLNREPAGIAGYWLCRADGSEWTQPTWSSRLKIPDRIDDRSTRIQQVRPGMTPHEVTHLVGMPDVEWHQWDYDLLAESVTVRLKWDLHTEHVESIERHPPAWCNLADRAAWI